MWPWANDSTSLCLPSLICYLGTIKVITPWGCWGKINALIQSILIIHVFPEYKFTHSLKFICNPKVSIYRAFVVIQRHVQRGKTFSLCDTHIPKLGRTRDRSTFLFQPFPPRTKRLFRSILSAPFSTFSCFLLVILLFTLAPGPVAKVPCRVPKREKAMMSLKEKITRVGRASVRPELEHCCRP